MKPETSTELLERVRAKSGCSWWALPKVLGVSESTVKNWKRGRTIVDRRYAPRIAALLDEPAEYVLACLEAERESDPAVRRVLERIAAKFAASILLPAILTALLAKPGISRADAPLAVSSEPPSAYYGKLKGFWARLAALKNKRRRPMSGRPCTKPSTGGLPKSWQHLPAYT